MRIVLERQRPGSRWKRHHLPVGGGEWDHLTGPDAYRLQRADDGSCEHDYVLTFSWPAHLGRPPVARDCDSPVWWRCVRCGATQARRCKARSSRRCGPCSKRHQSHVREVFASGSRPDDPRQRHFVLTVTAPGAKRHRDKTRPGHPWCLCTPDGGVDLGDWNASIGERWNGFILALRRLVLSHQGGWKGCVGPAKRGQRETKAVSFAKAIEPQERKALHIHALLRCEVDLVQVLDEVRALAMAHGFGHEVDVMALPPERAAAYLSKYVTKAVDVRAEIPWKLEHVDYDTGEVVRARASYRPWSAAKDWGKTLSQVHLERIAFMKAKEAAAGGGEPACPAAPEAPLDSLTQRSTRQEAFSFTERAFGPIELV